MDNIYSTNCELSMPLNYNNITHNNLQIEYTKKLLKKINKKSTSSSSDKNKEINITDILKEYKLELCENSKVTLKKALSNYRRHKLEISAEQYIEEVSKFVIFKKRGSGGSFHGVNMIKVSKK